MKKTFVLALFPSLILAACGNGVPKVSDPHNIVVDGQKMTQASFLQTYCVGKVGNETCDKVANAMSRDATKGTVPRF